MSLNPSPTKFLTIDEVHAVLDHLDKKKRKSLNAFLNLVVFRLSCCCGLRVKEITGLKLGDLTLTGPRPCIHVGKEITKGQCGKRRGRDVPLWWDRSTLDDLLKWITWRYNCGFTPDDAMICALRPECFGRGASKRQIQRRWATAIKSLGKDRGKQLSIHAGRHTFASLSMQGGHSLAEVRDALGHSNISITSVYLHCYARDDLPDVFGYQRYVPETSLPKSALRKMPMYRVPQRAITSPFADPDGRSYRFACRTHSTTPTPSIQ